MAIDKKRKEEIVDKIKSIIDEANTVVFANFHGLGVATETEMRNSLREQDVKYLVAKKTLIKRAFAESDISGELPDLLGEVSIATSVDEISPARAIYEFHKENPDTLNILGGVFEGEYRDVNFMTEIASIPSQEVLYGKFVNVINSPIQGLVVALDAIAKKKEA